ncbi:ATP synthase delta chain [hydrothermal vent metagenome]|uniref:ATP synthase delta chain n=1 Tax=hydrothermal vent metagenome TaxID=652676 RepID=A0A1W1C730_9ZZZZ
MEELIAKRYVDALLSLSNEEEKSLFVKTFNELALSLNDPEISAMINAPIVAVSDKVESLLATLGEKPNDKLVNFIKLLGEHKRLNLIPAISSVMNAQMQKESNTYDGIISSDKKLSAEDVAKLENTLKRYTGSDIKLSQKSSKLNGIKVDVEDLGIEVNFSKERVREQLIDFIMKSQ